MSNRVQCELYSGRTLNYIHYQGPEICLTGAQLGGACLPPKKACPPCRGGGAEVLNRGVYIVPNITNFPENLKKKKGPTVYFIKIMPLSLIVKTLHSFEVTEEAQTLETPNSQTQTRDNSELHIPYFFFSEMFTGRGMNLSEGA